MLGPGAGARRGKRGEGLKAEKRMAFFYPPSASIFISRLPPSSLSLFFAFSLCHLRFRCLSLTVSASVSVRLGFCLPACLLRLPTRSPLLLFSCLRQMPSIHPSIQGNPSLSFLSTPSLFCFSFVGHKVSVSVRYLPYHIKKHSS